MTTSSSVFDQLFEQFCKEREYVKNSSHHTILFYKASYKKFKESLGDDIDLSKDHLNRFVLSMREKGVKPETYNVYIRGMNSFLGWLFENEHITERLKVKQLKTEQKLMQTFSAIESYSFIQAKNLHRSQASCSTLLSNG
jgi:site-specific recombinase XerD